MSCFRGNVLIFAVLSILCTHCVLSDETAKVADTNRTDATPATLTFKRTCTQHYDCNYRNAQTRSAVFLKCEQGICQCSNPPYIVQDVANYPVRVLNDDCMVRSAAPCGTTDGITLVCEKGRTCIEGRCRSQIRSVIKNWACDEDIDCQEGLKCLYNDSFPIVYYCLEA